MQSEITPKLSNLRKRHYGLVMTFVVVFIALIYIAPYGLSLFMNHSEGEATDTAPQSDETLYARSNPIELSIPKLNLKTSFVTPLGLAPDQTIMVPDSYEQVGWYEGGATPGEVGPAVILGHVDSLDGPAIFYSLGQLAVGDEIEVKREDGSVATFLVTKLQRYPQSNFPTEAVYGPTERPTLRLVTCTGTFNRGEQRYSHNLVVYAELKE